MQLIQPPSPEKVANFANVYLCARVYLSCLLIHLCFSVFPCVLVSHRGAILKRSEIKIESNSDGLFWRSAIRIYIYLQTNQLKKCRVRPIKETVNMLSFVGWTIRCNRVYWCNNSL